MGYQAIGQQLEFHKGRYIFNQQEFDFSALDSVLVLTEEQVPQFLKLARIGKHEYIWKQVTLYSAGTVGLGVAGVYFADRVIDNTILFAVTAGMLAGVVAIAVPFTIVGGSLWAYNGIKEKRYRRGFLKDYNDQSSKRIGKANLEVDLKLSLTGVGVQINF